MQNSAKQILGGHLTGLSLLALGLAVALGILGNATGSPVIDMLASGLAPLGGVWVSALRMTVIPLVLTQLLSALTSPAGGSSIGRLGGRTLGWFLLFLVTLGVTTVLMMSPVMRWVSVDPGTSANLLAGTAIPPEAWSIADSSPNSFGEWIQRLVPSNVFAALVEGEILPLLLCTLVFGLGVRRLEGDRQALLAELFRGLADAVMQIVFWILWLTPLAVFALVLSLTRTTEGEALGLLVFYVAAVTCWILVATAALYPVSALLGRVPLRAFARAMAPANMVALSTRSSLASLPALVEGGKRHLRLSSSATGLILPLSASVFKLSTVTAEPVRYLFLAQLFGLELTSLQTASFLLTLVILSFIGVGIPGGGSGFDTLPAYAAAGIPIEGLVMVVAVDTIPDVAKTLVNATGYLSVATIATVGETVQPATLR